MKSLCSFLMILLLTPNLFGQRWQIRNVDTVGVNPTITLDSQDNPHVAFVLTGQDEFDVNYATWNESAGGFDIETVFEGGERWLDITVDQNDLAHITQHIHGFGGDLVHHFDNGTEWTTERLFHVGHDGWSSAILMNSSNYPCISYIDPACCSGQGLGMEYREFNGTDWTVEIIGSTPDVGLRAGTSMDLDSEDNPHITYYDEVRKDLMYAVRENLIWTFTSVDTAGDVGYYSSIKVNNEGMPRISYYQALTAETGLIKHAAFDGASWQILVIDSLENVSMGASGGLTSHDLDVFGNSHFTWCDQSILKYAVIQGSIVDVDVVVDYTDADTSIGYTTSMELDGNGNPHIVYWIVANNNKTTCRYATRIPSLEAPIRVNVGGREYASVGGDVFASDREYNSGSFGYVRGAKRLTTGEIGGTEDDLLYQSYRRDMLLEYRFDLPDGNYTITCHFTEPTTKATGQRVFDILAEGIVMSDDFEIFQKTGSRLIAHSEVFQTTVVDGTLNLEFRHVSGEGEPLVSALEVAASIPDFERLNATSSIDDLRLSQNYPNPFNPRTNIEFSIPSAGIVSLKVFNLLGEEVATLASDAMDAGTHTIRWDATGKPSGVYFYRLSVVPHRGNGQARSDGDGQTGEFTEIRKLVLLK